MYFDAIDIDCDQLNFLSLYRNNHASVINESTHRLMHRRYIFCFLLLLVTVLQLSIPGCSSASEHHPRWDIIRQSWSLCTDALRYTPLNTSPGNTFGTPDTRNVSIERINHTKRRSFTTCLTAICTILMELHVLFENLDRRRRLHTSHDVRKFNRAMRDCEK